MHNDFNKKKWPLYTWMYNLQNCIQFETIPTSKTKTATLNTGTTCLFISLCISLCTCLIATSQEFLARECECDHYLKFVFHCANEQKIPENTSMKLKTTISDLIFKMPSILCFWLVFEFVWRILIVRVKIWYTFHGPCLHGLPGNKPLAE